MDDINNLPERGDVVVVRAWWRDSKETKCQVKSVYVEKDPPRYRKQIIGVDLIPLEGNPHLRAIYDWDEVYCYRVGNFRMGGYNG